MVKERTIELMKIAHKVSELFQEELNKLPYGANIIDELHAGENAHSRILRMLLQYSGGGKYPVYSSFIKLLKDICKELPDDISCHMPEFVNEEGRIDLLIKEYTKKNRFAIIIENKVCGAIDQDEQIQRYIEKVEQNNIAPNRIIVVYLTKDGEKDVSDISLTDSAREKLDVTNESDGRFVRLNYKYHILPWLQNDVMPNVALKEEILISSIRLYVDYLKGICGEREYEKPIHDLIKFKMKEMLNIKSISECVTAYKEVESLHENMSNMLVDEARNLMEEKFYKPMVDLFKKKYPNLSIRFKDKGVDSRHFWFDIIVSSWSKTKIRFTFDSSGQYFGISYLDQMNRVDKNVVDYLKEKFDYGKSSSWWPWYGMLKKKIQNSDSLEIWNSFENGEFIDFFEQWFDNMIKYTDEFEM